MKVVVSPRKKLHGELLEMRAVCVRAHFLVVRWGGGSDNKPGTNTHLHLSVLAPTFPPWVHTLPAK